jgi:hypothetical protein
VAGQLNLELFVQRPPAPRLDPVSRRGPHRPIAAVAPVRSNRTTWNSSPRSGTANPIRVLLMIAPVTLSKLVKTYRYTPGTAASGPSQ